MTARHPADGWLRRAFQALADSVAEPCSREDLDRIWLAASGELTAAERHEIVELLAISPACAEAWRVAYELRSSVPPVPVAVDTRRWMHRSAPWLAAAAVLLLATAVVLVSRRQEPADTTLRTATQYVVESLVPSGATLPRDAFHLRWNAGPQDSRYQVRVSTDDLRVITTAADLPVSELVVNPALLADLPTRSRIFWQVEVAFPNGERISSRTFVVLVQ